ncbi:HAD-IIB family hydrolase [Hydrogenophaga sp. 5NK40-0174]|uniref:HAD-IIB family hydrolase n=1 Tax=Hydrogenophaga sp. 5NK40-0174 TaxID=3127649 RepID=UPI003107ADDD
MTPSPNAPIPLADWPLVSRQQVAGILTDIDDTLTKDGKLMASARAALTRCEQEGLPVVAVTGRPAGWSEAFALSWPVRAIVAENGAVMLWRRADGGLGKDWIQPETERAENAARLAEAAYTVLREFPMARLAGDSAGRETDIAIDHSEHHHLGASEVDAIGARLTELGFRVTVSSIHINAWLGEHDKWSGARWALKERLQVDLVQSVDRWIYVGDSANDQVMFARMALSVGVRNIEPVLTQLATPPRYITAGMRGDGFSEVVDAVLSHGG